MSELSDDLGWMEELVAVSRSGMPMPEGLRAAADECRSRSLARQLRQIAEAIQDGTSWEQVLASTARSRSRYLLGLLRAGMRSGNLAAVLHGIVDHHRQRHEIWRQLAWSLAYPLVAFGLAVILLLLALLLLVPAMAEIFADFGTELPVVTQFWIQLSQVVPALSLCVGVGLLILLLLIRMFGGAAGWYRFLGSVPVLGPMIHWAGVAEMIRMWQLCIVQEIPLPDALRLTAMALKNANMARVSNWLADGTEQGVPLAKMLDATPRVPNFIVPIIQWGEQQNALEEALENVHALLIGRIRMRSSLLSGILTPLIFIFVAATAGGLVIGMFVPLVTLLQNLT